MTAPDLTPEERAKVEAFGLDHEPHISPDCRDEKHLACTRHDAAWCETDDDYRNCECGCHETEQHA